MPRYYFQTDDDDELFSDKEGIELVGPQAARREALAALPDMAHEKVPDGRDQRTFRATVRNDGGEIVFEGTLTL